MKPDDLKKFLRDKIPLAAALDIRVVRADRDKAEIAAPLKPNINHFNTAFGGSLHAVLVLSCYSWLFQALEERGLSSHVVLKSSKTNYLGPVKSDFSAVCLAPAQTDQDRFFKTMEKKNRAKIILKATVSLNGAVACELEGEFVAVPS